MEYRFSFIGCKEGNKEDRKHDKLVESRENGGKVERDEGEERGEDKR